jgi:glutamate decarboxylase
VQRCRSDPKERSTWTLTHDRAWDLHDLSARLRERGLQVPAYPMPADLQDMTVMRVVFRIGISMDLTSLLLADIRSSVEYLGSLPSPLPKSAAPTSAFHH